MKFQLIGVNHKSAPVEVRERLAIPESRMPEAYKHLCNQPGVDEAMILCTCNRVEVLANTTVQAITRNTTGQRGRLHVHATAAGSTAGGRTTRTCSPRPARTT